MPAPLTIVVDTREQRPLFGVPEEVGVVIDVGPHVQAVRGTLGEGDYSALGFEHVARIERKSSDLIASVTWEHNRFNAELARLTMFDRAVLLIVGASDFRDLADQMRVTRRQLGPAREILRALQWTGRLPIVWASTAEQAAAYVEWALAEVVEDLSPHRIERCHHIFLQAAKERVALGLSPVASRAAARAEAAMVEFGLCVVCARRPPVRPKAPGPRVCACGRLQVGARKDIGRAA